MKATVIPNVKKDTLRDVVLQNVEAGSFVLTDELYSYNLLTSEFTFQANNRQRVNGMFDLLVG